MSIIALVFLLGMVVVVAVAISRVSGLTLGFVLSVAVLVVASLGVFVLGMSIVAAPVGVVNPAPQSKELSLAEDKTTTRPLSPPPQPETSPKPVPDASADKGEFPEFRWPAPWAAALHSGNYEVVSSRRFASQKEANADALQRARDLVLLRYHEEHRGQPARVLSPQRVQEFAVRNSFTEELTVDLGAVTSQMVIVHLLVNVGPETMNQLHAIWQEQLVQQRIRILGFLLAFSTGLLLIAHVYLRCRLLTRPQHRRKLKLAAIVLAFLLCLTAGGLLPVVAAL